MIVTYQGGESFKISQGDLSLSINPLTKTSADVTLLSSSAFGGEQSGKQGFVVSGPGEYEVKDIIIKGFLSEGAEGRINTIYMISFEGMNLCFLGELGNPALTSETLESLEDIDILFAPIGGEGVLDAAAAYKLAVSLEPKVVVPMHYPRSGGVLAQFLKEAGEKETKPIDKLVVKKKDLDGKQAEVIVLAAE